METFVAWKIPKLYFLCFIEKGYHVTMVPELVRIPPGGDLVVWCNVTDSEENYTFSWFWAAGDGYHFTWPLSLNKSNAISANHNYSKLHAPSADVTWSGRFFCLVEKNGVDDAPRLHHVDVEVACELTACAHTYVCFDVACDYHIVCCSLLTELELIAFF